jgi:hypothetical protein
MDISTRHHLPIVHLSVADLLAGKTGTTGHAEVTDAWHQSDHTDPGPDFPWAGFITLISQGGDMLDTADKQFITGVKQELKDYVGSVGKTLLGPRNPDGSDADPGHYNIGDIGADLKALKEQVAAMPGGLAPIDYDLLATKVVDQLKARL